MRRGYGVSARELALSEVIGFVLILAILTAAFSLYLVYGVPVQGRENEISHMNDIKDQFVSYKLGVDSLWTNDQTGLALSSSFPLGTAAQSAQGTSGFLPVLQPIGSSGTLAINLRTAEPEVITVSSKSYILNATPMTSVPVNIPSEQVYLNAPSSLLINISTMNANSTNPAPGSIQINGNTWNASINVTPNISDCLSIVNNNVTYQSNCYGSDITITVVKNGVKTLDRAIVYSNIQPGSSNVYSINLMDSAYGLQSLTTYPTTLHFIKNDPQNQLIFASLTSQYNYQYQPNFSYSVPLGSLEYTANNNYWLSQSYYYQMGGIFLSQIDGITYKVPPEITFSNNGNGNFSVNIVALAYTPASSGIVGGTSPAQVSTRLVNSGNLPYADISPNSGSATITITTPDPDAQLMWKKYLNEAANQTGGIPNSSYSVGTFSNSTSISFPELPDGNPYITLKVKTANISANLQAVGGA